MDQLLLDAARNNAEWCDVVCRAHRLPTEFAGGVWRSARRTPQFYPDAVTLTPGAEDVLTGIDARPGCSVKDSFADLDLSGHGFQVLFDAEWIMRDPPTVDATDWVESPAAWDFGAPVDDPEVAFLVAPDGSGGVVANRSGSVVGLSNVLATGDPVQVWQDAVRAVAVRFPGLPMVGYERGDDLPPALAAGFDTIGPLRVWLNAG